MGPDRTDEQSSTENAARRRTVLKTIGGAVVMGTIGTGAAAARGPPDDRGNGPPDDRGNGPPGGDDEPEERTIEWNGRRGSEHAEQDCEDGAVGYWHWILTPGGSTEFESVGELAVTFGDGSEQSVQGSQKGNGAYHFDVRKRGGGEITDASVAVEGGGRNALLTISDGECEAAGTRYWQVDFGEGEVKDPPSYWPDDVMAALGNSDDGVTDNPSLRRQRTEGQLGDVTIVGNAFTFDDDGDPSEVTVDFEIEAGGEERDLHLSSFTLPGSFDVDEIDEQELHDATTGTFAGGDSGTLTIDVP